MSTETEIKRQSQEKESEEPERDGSPEIGIRAHFAELIGTFALTFVSAGSEIVAQLNPGAVDHTARALAPGLVVMAMIYSIGNVSGAHINPAVTLAFTLRQAFPWQRLLSYWLFQMLGAILAAFVLKLLFGNVAHLGASSPQHGVTTSFVMEIILTVFLVTVILSTSSRHQVIGANAALAVGGTIAFCGLFAGPVSGASMNPARSLGPVIVAWDFSNAWIYLAGPILGALIAVFFTWLLHGPKKQEEDDAAEGEDGKKQSQG
ncbi:MAG TPA: aquaporin [Chloroflexia bacterium]|nr:aquaporin [Chloroflexia bacterium]